MDAIQKQKILSIDITLKKLGARGPKTAFTDKGIYWVFEHGDYRVFCGIFVAGKRWVFGASFNGLPENLAQKITSKLRPLAYYDDDLDETVRVANKRAVTVKQIVNEVLG